jgi:biotin carboxyl carrier protein
MQLRLRFSLLKWPVTLLALGGLLAAARFVHGLARQEREAEGGGEAVRRPRLAEGRVVKLGPELAKSHGVRDERARPISWTRRVTVFGRVVPNPQATAEVRAPFAGTLRADKTWPAIGRWVDADQTLGRIAVRFGPQEQLDLRVKLNEAQIKQQGAEEVLEIHQARVDRLKKLSAPETIARRELDEALTALAEARTQANAAKAAVGLWQKALDAVKRRGGPKAGWSEALTAPAAGEVVELTARPGMAVEAGALLARLVDFRRPLVRLDFPPELLAVGPPEKVELFGDATPAGAGLGEGDHPRADRGQAVPATLAGPAPQVDVASQFASYWYEVRFAPSPSEPGPKVSRGWRPGLFVQAYLPVPSAKPRPAVAVPRTALLYHQGATWVYVRTAPGVYERRPVRLLGREGDRVVLGAGVEAGQPVVCSPPQVLLSEELRGEVDDN